MTEASAAMNAADTARLSALVRGVRVVSLDAGGTIIFLDQPRVARFVQARGHDVDVAAIVAGESEAKRRLEHDRSAMVSVPFDGDDKPGAAAWGRMVATFLHIAGIPLAGLGALMGDLWRDHVRFNLWSLVPPGLGAALDAVRARGVRVVVVSNSEGMLDPLFTELELHRHLDRLVDSGVVGVEKPDPRIFAIALEGTPPSEALHLGDTFTTDVVGARNAGMRHAFIDVHDAYAGMHADVPRVTSVVEVCEAILRERG